MPHILISLNVKCSFPTIHRKEKMFSSLFETTEPCFSKHHSLLLPEMILGKHREILLNVGLSFI
jgi:hypothetical protein